MRGSLQTEEGGDTGLFSPLPQAHEIAGWVTFCVSESSPHGDGKAGSWWLATQGSGQAFVHLLCGLG